MPFSAKQRQEDLFCLASLVFDSTGVATTTATVRVPIACTIDHAVFNIATAAGGTTPSAYITLWQQPFNGIVSNGTKLLGTGASGLSPSGATQLGNAIGGVGATDATSYFSYPSSGSAQGGDKTAYWNLDRGNLLGIQTLRLNADNIVPITVQIWAYRRTD